jgi:hypothetical protein
MSPFSKEIAASGNSKKYEKQKGRAISDEPIA